MILPFFMALTVITQKYLSGYWADRSIQDGFTHVPSWRQLGVWAQLYIFPSLCSLSQGLTALLLLQGGGIVYLAAQGSYKESQRQEIEAQSVKAWL